MGAPQPSPASYPVYGIDRRWGFTTWVYLISRIKALGKDTAFREVRCASALEILSWDLDDGWWVDSWWVYGGCPSPTVPRIEDWNCWKIFEGPIFFEYEKRGRLMSILMVLWLATKRFKDMLGGFWGEPGGGISSRAISSPGYLIEPMSLKRRPLLPNPRLVCLSKGHQFQQVF